MSAPHRTLVVLTLLLGLAAPSPAVEFRARVVDRDAATPLPCRVHLRAEAGPWVFVRSADPDGTALPYREQWVPMSGIEDQHTTVSAHPFVADLVPGTRYTIEIERGKEYLPFGESFVMSDAPVDRTISLIRWIDARSQGWFSGETHVHRRLQELTNVMRAEDLDIAFPVTFWTTRSDRAPDLAPSSLRRQGPSPFGPREDRGTAPIWIDPDRVVIPRNTEYEVFSVRDRPHTLGALFLLNHRSHPDLLAPPIRPIAERAHAEGALLDLDKHSWPWSLMLVPIAKVDLFELSNNSVWRTRFGFDQAPPDLPAWMDVEYHAPGRLTEWGWLKYGFGVYYALLDSGFRLAPTAGTASGVHPVPLGHSRVYVHTGSRMVPADWLAGLRAGRSFVTTGPMLFARLDGKWPGSSFEFPADGGPAVDLELDLEAIGVQPVSTVEVLVNGRVVQRFDGPTSRTPAGAWSTRHRRSLRVTESSWIAVRCMEPRADGRQRFAHTGSWWVTIGGQPITPRREEVEWLVAQMTREIARQRPVLAPEALAEFEEALQIYQALLPRAQASGPASTSVASRREPEIRSGDPALGTCFTSPTPALARVLSDPAAHRLQILVAEVAQDASGRPRLRRHGFRVDAEYFYPASSIKLCAAVAALQTVERLEATHDSGPLVDAPFTIDPLFPGDRRQSMDTGDATHPDGFPITVRREIRKLALVSDNQAFNRFFDLVGHREINRSMHALGLGSVVVNHRLSDPRTLPDPLAHAAVEFRPTDRPTLRMPAGVGSPVFSNRPSGLKIGIGYLKGDTTVPEPMDFTFKNGISLVDLQNLLVKVVRPDLETETPQLPLTPKHRALLVEAMTQMPRESEDPVYPAADFPDSFGKFLLPGIRRVFPETNPGRRIDVTGKIGRAYGFSVENAYLSNPANGRAVFVTATLYTNADGILNDDRYEYETVADPFLADLGERIARRWLADPP